MAASLEDVLSLLKKWKKDGNMLRMDLSQRGHMVLDGSVSIDEIPEDKAVVFTFGFPATADGTVRVPLSTEFVRFDILSSSTPRPLDPIAPTYDHCIQFTWTLSQDVCTICSVVHSGKEP
jgi:hypothetical protein